MPLHSTHVPMSSGQKVILITFLAETPDQSSVLSPGTPPTILNTFLWWIPVFWEYFSVSVFPFRVCAIGVCFLCGQETHAVAQPTEIHDQTGSNYHSGNHSHLLDPKFLCFCILQNVGDWLQTSCLWLNVCSGSTERPSRRAHCGQILADSARHLVLYQ